jgi:hypothetical protein
MVAYTVVVKQAIGLKEEKDRKKENCQQGKAQLERPKSNLSTSKGT